MLVGACPTKEPTVLRARKRFLSDRPPELAKAALVSPRQEVPDPMRPCEYCGRHCRVPVTRYMPDRVQAAYAAAGCDYICTCEQGRAAEQKQFGASYENVISDRVGRVLAPPAETLAAAEEQRQAGRDVRDDSVRIRAQADQATARSRDLLIQTKGFVLPERGADLR